jgi:sugar diacid utilization regulator
MKGSQAMEVTLRELLAASQFLHSEPIAGRAGLDHRVTSLIVLDSPDGYKFTEPDMLVVTSGYFLSNENAAAQLDLIKNLAARGVSGMAIKTSHFKDNQIPQHLVSQAETLDFPLIILLENSYSFRDLLTFFDTSLYCRGMNTFIRKDEFPIKFIQCLKSENIPGLAKQLSQLLGRNVTVLFDQMVVTYPAEHTNDVFPQKIAGFSSQRQIHPSQSFRGLLEYRCKDVGASGQAVLGLGMRFTYKSNSSCSIWIDCSELPPDENDEFLLKSVQLACEIENKQITNYQQEHEQHLAQFIEGLLSGQIQPGHEAALLSVSFNWRIPLETQLLVISCAGQAEFYLDIGSAVRSFFRSKSETSIVYLYQNCVVIFLPPSYINHIGLCTELRSELEMRFPKDHFVLGLGHAVALKNANLSYGQAKYAAKIGEQINTGHTVHQFRKLGFYRLACPAALPDEVARFCKDYLNPILEMDKTTSLDLLNTLRSYFECQESYSHTGKMLFVQPNTVRYRMEVIEKACHIDFSNHLDSLNMKLALYLLPAISFDAFI